MQNDCNELNFKIEVRNMFMTNSYNIEESKKVPIILSWLGSDRLRFVQILTDNGYEKCQTNLRLFHVLSEKFKPQHNETILPLQYSII